MDDLPPLHLVSHPLCPYVQRAAILLQEKGLPYERSDIDLGDKPAWFLELSPLGRTPVLAVGPAVVFESQVIVEFLDEITTGSLHPEDPLERARHRSWIEFGSETLNAIARFYNAPDADGFERHRIGLREKISRLEREIEGPTFARRKFHIIDAVYGTVFRYLDVFDRFGDFGLTSGLGRVDAWREHLRARPSIRSAVGEDYPERLRAFVARRGSYLSMLVPAAL